jgi:zinc transporter 1/2/3
MFCIVHQYIKTYLFYRNLWSKYHLRTVFKNDLSVGIVMNLEFVKLSFAFVILVIGFSGASLPWVIPSMRQGGRLLALGDTFAAGVLGGAGLIHLLGGGIEGFRHVAPGLHYPFALLLAGLSFLFILFIEGVIIGEHHPVGSGYRHTGSVHEIASSGFTEIDHAYAFILLVVLSIHSIILGLTLGAQQKLNQMMVVFIAILAHKLFAGFALGVRYMRAGFKWHKAMGPIIFFAFMVPSGILIGTITGALLSWSCGLWFEAIFDSVGAGTFLYIASLDIISTEFHEPEAGDRMLKWILTVVGYGVMAGLAVIL